MEQRRLRRRLPRSGIQKGRPRAVEGLSRFHARSTPEHPAPGKCFRTPARKRCHPDRPYGPGQRPRAQRSRDRGLQNRQAQKRRRRPQEPATKHLRACRQGNLRMEPGSPGLPLPPEQRKPGHRARCQADRPGRENHPGNRRGHPRKGVPPKTRLLLPRLRLQAHLPRPRRAAWPILTSPLWSACASPNVARRRSAAAFQCGLPPLPLPSRRAYARLRTLLKPSSRAPRWPLPGQKDKGRLDGIEAPYSRIRDGPVYFIVAFFGAFLAAFFAFFAINFLLYDVSCSSEEGLPRPFLPSVSRIRAGFATVKTIPQKMHAAP